MDIEWYRQQLLALEQELEEKIAREVEEARETRDDQRQGTDEGSVEELKDDSLRLAENDSDLLENVRAALRRIDNGTFGRCIVDQGPIEESRLRAF